MTSFYPFHFAFLVKDLAKTRAFYVDVMGCEEGRSSKTWIDFDFFGNQLSAHLSQEIPMAKECGEVESFFVPVPHFGAIIGDDAFQALAERLKNASVEFVIPPTVRYPGKVGEQRTMFFKDPSGNAIEIKSFKDEAQIFSK